MPVSRLNTDTHIFVLCWPDCKPEGPLFSAEFVCLSVCLSVSDRHFYPSVLTGILKQTSVISTDYAIKQIFAARIH